MKQFTSKVPIGHSTSILKKTRLLAFAITAALCSFLHANDLNAQSVFTDGFEGVAVAGAVANSGGASGDPRLIIPATIWTTSGTNFTTFTGTAPTPPTSLALANSAPASQTWTMTVPVRNFYDAVINGVTFNYRATATSYNFLTVTVNGIPVYAGAMATDAVFHTVTTTFAPVTAAALLNVQFTVSGGVHSAGGTFRLDNVNIGGSFVFNNSLTADIRQPYYVSPISTPSLLPILDLDLNYLNTGSTTSYLNLFVMDTLTHTKMWGAENLELDTTAQAQNLHYELTLPSMFSAGQTVSGVGVYYTITDTIWHNPPMPSDSLFTYYSVQPDTVNFGGEGLIDTFSINPFLADLAFRPVVYGAPAVTDTNINYKGMPNIDLDSTSNPADTPTYAGDKNACGAAGCANSLQWLGRVKYPGRIDTVSGLRDKLKELSKLMGRGPNMGAGGIPVVKGKLAYADKYKLPVRVKFQEMFIKDSLIKSPNTDYNHYALNYNANRTDTAKKSKLTWDFVLGELKAGADVEMGMVTVGKKGDKTFSFGHIVTLVGISQKDGVKRLKYVHDDDQIKAGGTETREITIDTVAGGVFYIKSGDKKYGDTSRTFLTAFFSENLDTNIKFTGARASSVIPVQGYAFDVKVYNNPFNGQEPATLEFAAQPGENLTIEVTDISGRLVHRYSGTTSAFNRYSWTAGTDGKIKAGIYIISIRAGADAATVKVVKE